MSTNDIRFILSEIPDGCFLIRGDAEVRALCGVPPPTLHKAFVEASLQDLFLASHRCVEKLQAVFRVQEDGVGGILHGRHNQLESVSLENKRKRKHR